jgi:endogenous inhibitor of DNA gyrase (YacG/DUF329 family)
MSTTSCDAPDCRKPGVIYQEYGRYCEDHCEMADLRHALQVIAEGEPCFDGVLNVPCPGCEAKIALARAALDAED